MTGSIESLKKLHTVLIDTHRGYEEALKEARADSSSSALAPLFREMIDLRGKAHMDIHEVLISLGEKPDDSGSFMTTVHRIAIDARAMVTGLNESLPSFISGEEQVIAVYDETLEANAGNAKITDVLMRQKQSLRAEISKMKSLQAV